MSFVPIVVASVAGLTSIILGILNRDNKVKLEKWKQHLKGITWVKDDYIANAFIIGPKFSGKSSIAQLWKDPTTDIASISPTSRVEDFFIKSQDPFETFTEDHPIFRFKSTYDRFLKLKIRDFPGEDNQRNLAFKYLEELEVRAILILVMRVGYDGNNISYSDENADYYSTSFVQSIQNNISNIPRSILKVFVVFNKKDMLPHEWDEDVALGKLKAANSEALKKIRKEFAPDIEYIITSAQSNYGLTKLHGKLLNLLMSAGEYV